MADGEFSVKEIVQEMREDIKSLLTEQAGMKVTLEAVHKQAALTNGRVTALEKSDAKTSTKIGIASTAVASVFAGIVAFFVKSHT